MNEHAPPAELNEALDRLWKQFLPQIEERVDLLEAASEALTAGKLSDERRDAAQAAAHKLAGVLGTFGLTKGTILAREAEMLYAGDDADPAAAAQLTDIAARLRDTRIGANIESTADRDSTLFLSDKNDPFAPQLGLSFEEPRPARRIWPVRELVGQVRDLVEQEFGDVWVEGEISNFRPAPSGHVYFTLKDADAQLPVVLFRRQARCCASGQRMGCMCWSAGG